MENLKTFNEAQSREEWIQMAELPESIKSVVLSADILIVPSMMSKQPMAFMSGTMELFAYLQAEVGDRVEICTETMIMWKSN